MNRNKLDDTSGRKAVQRNYSSNLAVREALEQKIPAELSSLRKLNGRKRAIELILFPTLWLCGAILSIQSHHFLSGRLSLLLLGVGFLVSAVALNAFVLLLHEGMHRTLFPHRALNRWVSMVLGGTVLISFTAYQIMHLRHHQYLGDPRDPDDYHNYSDRPAVVWVLHYVRLLSGAFLYIFLIPILSFRHGVPEEQKRILTEYALLGSLYSIILGLCPTDLVLQVWLIPLIGVGYFTNLRGFSQHGMTDAKDPLIASRSIETHPVVAFCLLNENLHLEHHLFPEIPSYHLRRLHRLVWTRLPRVVSGSSYLGFLLLFFRATLNRDESPIGLRIRNGGADLEATSVPE